MTPLLAGVLLASASWAVQSEVPPPVLYCYARATESGTVARREVKDASGHVVKEIFYTSVSAPPDVPPTCAEDTLRVQSIKTYEHDMDGRPIVERVFGPDERMERHSWLEYAEGEHRPVRRVTSEPSGMLRSETRWQAGREVTVLHFDDDRRVALVVGQMPADVEYAVAWGPTFEGWVCGVGSVRRAGAADTLAPAVHLRNLAQKDGMARFIKRFDAELLDARGRLIQERAQRPDDRVAATARLLAPREAAFHGGPDLRERFGRLDPGAYRLLAWHPHPETGALLECGVLELQIK